jgi:hypothetical protein
MLEGASCAGNAPILGQAAASAGIRITLWNTESVRWAEG